MYVSNSKVQYWGIKIHDICFHRTSWETYLFKVIHKGLTYSPYLLENIVLFPSKTAIHMPSMLFVYIQTEMMRANWLLSTISNISHQSALTVHTLGIFNFTWFMFLDCLLIQSKSIGHISEPSKSFICYVLFAIIITVQSITILSFPVY
jgi:hypothetical protein